MKNSIIILTTLLLFSCNKEQSKQITDCQCYEEQESLQTETNQNGMPQMVWVQDFQTTPTQDNCNTAHDWQYNNQGTIRWRKNCQ